MASIRLPTYFVSHGGGPWPWLEGEIRNAYGELERSLKAMLTDIGTSPKAILMVTGHWETNEFMASAGATPRMIYDYGGFPEYTYHIRYPAPGDPMLAARAVELLQAAGLGAGLDESPRLRSWNVFGDASDTTRGGRARGTVICAQRHGPGKPSLGGKSACTLAR